MQAGAAATSCSCLLDLPVVDEACYNPSQKAAHCIPSQDPDTLLASSNDELFPYIDRLTQNGDETVERHHIPIDQLSISDDVAAVSLNGINYMYNEHAVSVDHMVSESGTELMSHVDDDDARTNYIDGSSLEPV